MKNVFAFGKFAGQVAAVLAVSVSSAMAALPTSGTCGFIATFPHPEDAGRTLTGGVLRASDILGSIDFANHTISYNITMLSYNGSDVKYGAVTGSKTYTIGTALTEPSGAYPITFNVINQTISVSSDSGSADVTANVNATLNLLPTNSGNTILIQGGGSKITGVCQMM